MTTGRNRDVTRTRTALLDAALAVFLNNGYAAATTEEIVAAAGMTRGALYHHFAGKRGLFRGVIERLQQESVDALMSSEPFDDPWEAFTGQVMAALDPGFDQAKWRLLLIEAPVVLGGADMRQVHRGSLLRSIEHLLLATESDRSPSSLIRASVRAHLLTAAVEEAMLHLAHSDHPQRDRSVVQAELLRVLGAVCRPVGHGRGVGSRAI